MKRKAISLLMVFALLATLLPVSPPPSKDSPSHLMRRENLQPSSSMTVKGSRISS